VGRRMLLRLILILVKSKYLGWTAIDTKHWKALGVGDAKGNREKKKTVA
jgi:hypothetical protein